MFRFIGSLSTVLFFNEVETKKNRFICGILWLVWYKSSNVHKYQFWRHDNKPIELWSNKVIDEKINYIHGNPVEEGLVFKAEDYLYSSAADYAGERGLLDDVIVIK